MQRGLRFTTPRSTTRAKRQEAVAVAAEACAADSEKGYGERKYACGLIVPDDGSPEIFYMSRGDAGALLRVGQRVTYVPAVNRQGPIAHHVKPAELVEADRPRPARRRGTVTAVKPAESPTYGFVRPDAGGDDVFVAFVDVESAPGKLAEGDRVDYELVPNAGARKSNRTSGDPKYAVKCGHVVVLPKGAPKLGAPKASAGPAHLRRAPPPPSVGKVLRDKATGQLLAPAQQERAQLQAAMQASAREYEADQLRQAQRLSIGDRRRQGSPRAPTSDSVDEDQLAAELESLREKHDRELANLRTSHNREMGQLQDRHAALRDPVGALLSSTGCGQYRQKFAEQDIVSKADFDMLRMEDLLEVGLEQREADALAAALGI